MASAIWRRGAVEFSFSSPPTPVASVPLRSQTPTCCDSLTARPVRRQTQQHPFHPSAAADIWPIRLRSGQALQVEDPPSSGGLHESRSTSHDPRASSIQYPPSENSPINQSLINYITVPSPSPRFSRHVSSANVPLHLCAFVPHFLHFSLDFC